MPGPVACRTYASDLGVESGDRDLELRCPRGRMAGLESTGPRTRDGRRAGGQAETPDPPINTPSCPITLRIASTGQHSDGLASPRHPQLLQVHGGHGGSGDREPELLSRRSTFLAADACPRPVPPPVRPVRPVPPRPGSAPNATFD